MLIYLTVLNVCVNLYVLPVVYDLFIAYRCSSKYPWIHTCNIHSVCHFLNNNLLCYLMVLHHSTILTALKYPIFASSALGIWSISRIGYTRGYLTGNPAKASTLGITIFLHLPCLILAHQQHVSSGVTFCTMYDTVSSLSDHLLTVTW